MRKLWYSMLASIFVVFCIAGCSSETASVSEQVKYKIIIYTDGPPSTQIQQQVNTATDGKFNELQWIATKTTTIIQYPTFILTQNGKEILRTTNLEEFRQFLSHKQ